MKRRNRAGRRSLGITIGIAACAFMPMANAQEAAASRYIRVTDDEAAQTMRLEVAIKRFVPRDASWPGVELAGAVHVADPGFYDLLQGAMDEKDVVLFESVKPSGVRELSADLSDEQRVKITERRVRLLAMFIERQRARTGEIPASLEAVEGALDERFSTIIEGARTDGWGRPFEYVTTAEGFDIVSRGADGAPRGEGSAADIAFSDQEPFSASERGEGGGGIQKQLAQSLGLVFQPEAMNEGGPNWRNSDMSIDEVQERLEAQGVKGDGLFRMLSGESFGAKFAGMLLRLATSTEQSRIMTKIAMVEMLGMAEELMASNMGGGQQLMKVLIEDRNEVVVADLRRVIETEPDVETIGILYGAGHLPDMERRVTELGYTLADERWLPAITIDLRSGGILPEQARAMRQMMQSTIERQRAALERGKK